MKKLSRLLPLFLFLIAFSARMIPGPRTIDDSFITFRYAQNILAGEGFVYNAGEAIMGTTTPLFTFVMVVLGSVSGGTNAPFSEIAMLVNAIADGLTAALLFLLGKHFKQDLVGVAAALCWGVASHSVTFAIGGLETSVVVLLLVGMSYFYLTNRVTLAAFLASLALLTRPDTILLVGLIALDHFIRVLRKKQKLYWYDVVALMLLPLIWYGFATWQFGSPIPHSVQAKLGAYHLKPEEGLIRLLQHYATPFMADRWFGAAFAVGSGLLVYPFLYLVGARSFFKQDSRSLVIMVYPWLYLMVFAIANPLIFRWYLTPPLPFLFIGILAGAEVFLSSIFSQPKLHFTVFLQRSLLVLLIAIIPFVNLLCNWTLHPDHGPDRPAPGMAWFELELLYQKAAQIVQPFLTPNTTLAAGDVGVLGYYTQARILDTVGLNSPEALDYYPLDDKFYVTNYAVSPDLIIDQQPELVVLMEVYGRLGLFQDPRFIEQYDLLALIPSDIYGSEGMLIFIRK
ncbi:MAG: hypothetical protein K0B14_19200 [Anaerolineaceae bacterium]|nr:hypothetical protein [Anaerolineaceae bacterium]